MPQTATEDLWKFAAEYMPRIERAIEENLPLAPPRIDTRYNEAIRYAIFPGGKRLRPVLTLLGAELCGGDPDKVLKVAAAVEYIHTSSLIFDDLPCMDNTPHRRGKLAVHKQFGEGIANLVAIGLLNSTYSLAADHSEPARGLTAVLEIVDCVGPYGMVGGQSVDLMIAQQAECKVCARRELGSIQNLKTSSLIRLSLRLGAILSGAPPSLLTGLTKFAELLGQAYQISDDIIDFDEDIEAYGPSGEMKEFFLPTTASLAETVRQAKDELPTGDSRARECLVNLVDYVAARKY